MKSFMCMQFPTGREISDYIIFIRFCCSKLKYYNNRKLMGSFEGLTEVPSRMYRYYALT